MIAWKGVRLYSECIFHKVGSSPAVLTDAYTEDGLHKPLFQGSDLWEVAASQNNRIFQYDSNNIYPRKGHEFDEIEVPEFYERINGLTYTGRTPRLVEMVVEIFAGTGAMDPVRTSILGWIDSIEPVSMTSPKNNCRIRWHVDWWLTEQFYNQIIAHTGLMPIRRRVGYGAGRIKRTSVVGSARPGGSVPRRWVLKSSKKLSPPGEDGAAPWVIVAFTKTANSQTTLSFINWMPGTTVSDGGVTYNTPSWDDVYGGYIEERFGLDPKAVIGAWVSPSPASLSAVYHNNGYGAYEYFNSGSTVTIVTDLEQDVKTTDFEKYVFYDATGTEMFTAPWGLPFRRIFSQIDVGSSGANIQIYLAEDSEGDSRDNLTKASEGRLFSFPLPALPVTENAWASYNYSGERAYDIEAREIQRNQNAVNGIAGVGTSAIGGAIAGSMVLPGPGTIAGAVAGTATGLISTATGYFTSGHYDNRIQEATDKLAGSQTASMIITARGRRGIEPFGKTGDTFGWIVADMEADSVSLNEMSEEYTELGYPCDSYLTDCSAIVGTGGGLRIEGLEVKGDVPAEGRAYIAALFARGVHIDLIQ